VAGRPPQPHSVAESRGPEGQRERLVAAISKAAAEHGYSGLTIDRIIRNAGVERVVFDAHFESREQGLLAAQDAFLERLLWEATGACERPVPWPERLRAGLRAVLSSLIENASLARVLTVEADAAGLPFAESRLAALDEFARLMRSGREFFPAAERLPDITERVLVGGVESLLRQRLLREEPAATGALESELLELLLLPYLGRQDARRTAREPPST
jgi:AcrR family transcriptional regulator